MPSNSISPNSLRCREAIVSTVLASSRQVGWTSLLIDHHRIQPDDLAFKSVATPDQTIVVMLRGEQEFEVNANGLWKRATYQAGSVGLTPGGHVDRIRRRPSASSRSFEKANLYVPTSVFAEAAESYRRAGRTTPKAPLNELSFADPLLFQMASSLLKALAAGAPDLYAEGAAQWIATHMLCAHAREIDLEDGRGPGNITDQRLERVLEFMSVHFHEPLSLTRIAEEAGVSKFHFVRLFREKVGATPHAWLSDLRLRTARRMLASTDLAVTIIAGRCGFKRSCDLATAFSRRHGMSPVAYRKVLRGQPNGGGIAV